MGTRVSSRSSWPQLNRRIATALALLPCALALAQPAPQPFAGGPAWTADGLGQTAIFRMASAPFPHPARVYRDDRVLFFVPEGFRPGAEVDVVVHYHGHMGEIVRSDRTHRYREQLFLSKKNAVLLEPQGPLNARDSFGGKHEDALGLRRFLDEALGILVREGVTPRGATLRKVILSGHSGAYEVIARCLDRGGVEVAEVHLHDSIYGELASFEAWTRRGGHKLVSTYTRTGGTAANNQELARRLGAAGLSVSTRDDDASLAGASALFVACDVAHNDVTHARLHWKDVLERSVLADLGVPRPALRSVTRAGASAVDVSWYPVRSALLRGYRLYASDDPRGPFGLAADERSLTPGTTSCRVAAAGGARSWKLVAIDDGGRESAESNVYAASPAGSDRPRTLVVDGFVRTTGRWTQGSHPLAALVGRSVAAAGRSFDSARSSAVRDGSVRLDAYGAVIWLCGDQSTADAALDRVEQGALQAYLERGGTVVVSGSEVGFDLASPDAAPWDTTFLARVLRAGYAGDAARGGSVAGVGPLAGASATFGGANAAYAVPYPDFFAAGSGASVVLKYADGRGAGVAYEGPIGAGTARSGVLTVGFPLETVDSPAARDGLVARILDWQDAVNRRAGR